MQRLRRTDRRFHLALWRPWELGFGGVRDGGRGFVTRELGYNGPIDKDDTKRPSLLKNAISGILGRVWEEENDFFSVAEDNVHMGVVRHQATSELPISHRHHENLFHNEAP